MPPFNYLRAGTVEIDSKRYELVRDESSAIPFHKDYFDESPWEDGLPRHLNGKMFSWHLGGFKSYQDRSFMPREYIGQPVFTSEYGINTDGRWPNRLAPGPLINDIPLEGNSSSIKYIWQGEPDPAATNVDFATSGIWVVAGSRVYYTTNLTTSKIAFLDASDPPIMGVSWQNSVYIITEDRIIYQLVVVDNAEVPTGTGNLDDFTPSAGANWENVDDAGNDADVTYNESSTAGHIDLFATSDISGIAAQGVIQRVRLRASIRRTSTSGANPNMRGVCRVGSTNYFTTAQAIVGDTYTTYVFRFETNPATGLQWTEAEANAAEFGYELQSAPGVGAVRVTDLNIHTDIANWTTVDAFASWLAVGPKRLLKINDDGTDISLKNIIPGLGVTTEANWADEVIVPGTRVSDTRVPLVAYQKTAIVATDKGVHGIDVDGTGLRIIERIQYAPQTLAVQDPFLYVSHGHGLDRWLPGYVESCGIENEIENESVVKGVITSLTFLGRWTFAAITPASGNNHILVGRERREGEPGYGPMVWDTLIETGYNEILNYIYANRWAGTDQATSSFALFFEHNNSLGYCLFPETGGIPEIDASAYRFVQSGIRYTSRFRFGDLRSKTFYKVLFKGKNLTANVKWALAYRVDDGSWLTVDTNGTTMEAVADTLYEWILPLATTGVWIQFRLTYTSNDSTVRGWIEYLEPFAVPQSKKTPTMSIVLRLETETRHSDSIESRTGLEQYADLETLIEAGAVLTSGPWGESVYLYPKKIQITKLEQTDNIHPVIYAQLDCQVRE